jgi:hypothetical protein
MFTKSGHSPTGFLRWIGSFAAAMALIELWTGDYSDAAFQAALALLLFVEASERAPAGWLRIAQLSLIVLMASLLALRVMRWTGFLE